MALCRTHIAICRSYLLSPKSDNCLAPSYSLCTSATYTTLPDTTLPDTTLPDTTLPEENKSSALSSLGSCCQARQNPIYLHTYVHMAFSRDERKVDSPKIMHASAPCSHLGATTDTQYIAAYVIIPISIIAHSAVIIVIRIPSI